MFFQIEILFFFFVRIVFTFCLSSLLELFIRRKKSNYLKITKSPYNLKREKIFQVDVLDIIARLKHANKILIFRERDKVLIVNRIEMF